ncbi:hypothetical protein CEXT_697551 [Caerostris extrusa]|uniref:Uncharacterized protein n=1 Tax=Caerostris extrusa TaxID=172846 RepID=A0AAV4Y2U2_CAEEX|nr:hypothetical protein CEXT_697551 [Caerostris extrusa]
MRVSGVRMLPFAVAPNDFVNAARFGSMLRALIDFQLSRWPEVVDSEASFRLPHPLHSGMLPRFVGLLITSEKTTPSYLSNLFTLLL